MNAFVLALAFLFALTPTLSPREREESGALSQGERERAPEVAGRFYPAEPDALRAAVDALLAKAKPAKPAGPLVALLVPHAGIEFSGEAAAAGWDLVEPGRWDAVVVIGTGHFHAVEGAALYPGPYATPIGRAEYDAGLAAALLKASPLIVESAEAHGREHSIEVQVPFLLRRLGRVKLVALVMNAQELAPAVEVGRAIAKAVRGRRVLVAASSDLSHYPSGETADRVDKTSLRALASLDPAFFWMTNRFLMNRRPPGLECAYCGEGAVTAVMTAAKELGARKVVLLKRFNSGDVVSERDYGHVVGYAAAAFVGGKEGPAASPYGLGEADQKRLLADARAAIAARLDAKELEAPALADSPALNLPAAVFVTLARAGPGGRKDLRGCIGTTLPQEPLEAAVERFAQAAAFEDPRFPPLTREELGKVRVEVSILAPPRRVGGAGDIRPGKDGVIVENGGRSGLFLPQVWETLPGKAEFLAELCSQKAGLPRGCAADPKTALSVFSVESFEEP